MKPLNVLVLTSCYPVAHSPADGIFVRSQCEALAAAGASVTVVAPRPWVPPGFQALSSKWRSYRATPIYYDLHGIPVHRPRHIAPPRSDLWMPVDRQYARAATKVVRSRPDIVHAHFAYPGGVAGVRLAKAWNVPVVLTLHGDDVNVHPHKYPRLARALHVGVKHSQGVIAVSEALADRTFEQTGIRPSVAPIGINMDLFGAEMDRIKARQMLGLPLDRPILLHLGRLVPEKGIDDLLAAMDRLGIPGCLGLFVGDGPMIRAIGTRPDCRVVGVQPNEKVPHFLRAADALVLPSHSEGMPTVLVEAGACGLPIVATAVGGIPELLGEERGLLVPPRDVAALAAALKDVLGDRSGAHARATRLRNHVFERYDVKKSARRLLTEYERLIAAHSVNPAQRGVPCM